MLAVGLGLTCAIGFAIADFLGGNASKTTSPAVVTAISRVGSIPALVVIAVVVPATSVGSRDILLGVATGLFQLVAFRLLYGVLSRGSMGVSASLTGLLSAVLPLSWALSNGETLGWIGAMGVVVGLASVVIVSSSKSDATADARRLDPVQAAGAGLCFGLSFVAIGEASESARVVPLLIGQVVTALAAITAVLIMRGPRRPRPRAAAQAFFGGASASIAGAAFVWAVAVEVASVVAVLQATAPVFVALIALIVLKQKLSPRQGLGLLLAVLATVLLAV